MSTSLVERDTLLPDSPETLIYDKNAALTQFRDSTLALAAPELFKLFTLYVGGAGNLGMSIFSRAVNRQWHSSHIDAVREELPKFRKSYDDTDDLRFREVLRLLIDVHEEIKLRSKAAPVYGDSSYVASIMANALHRMGVRGVGTAYHNEHLHYFFDNAEYLLVIENIDFSAADDSANAGLDALRQCLAAISLHPHLACRDVKQSPEEVAQVVLLMTLMGMKVLHEQPEKPGCVEAWFTHNSDPLQTLLLTQSRMGRHIPQALKRQLRQKFVEVIPVTQQTLCDIERGLLAEQDICPLAYHAAEVWADDTITALVQVIRQFPYQGDTFMKIVLDAVCDPQLLRVEADHIDKQFHISSI